MSLSNESNQDSHPPEFQALHNRIDDVAGTMIQCFVKQGRYMNSRFNSVRLMVLVNLVIAIYVLFQVN